MALAVPKAMMSVFAMYSGDSMHMTPPALKTFADSNNWCTAEIPEFQDVQRFVQRDTLPGPALMTRAGYGPVVSAVSAPQIVNFMHTSAFNDRYSLVAVAYVWDQPEPMKVPYNNLHLTKGVNCVFLRYYETSGWTARVVPAISGIRCPTTESEIDAAPTIRVVPDDSTEAPGTIPPVVRFVQATDTSTFIGVRCGALWCNIGAGHRADIPAPTFVGTPGTPATVRARVKGWFDEQQIGIPNTGPLAITPSKFAAVIPVPNLRIISKEQFASAYQPVAYVYLSDTITKYEKRMGFTQGWNTIAIKGDTASQDWTAEITDSHHVKHYRYTRRYSHTYGDIPGTARWAWTWRDQDEWVWVACMVGCCLVQSGEDS